MAEALRVLRETGCPFGIKSGGHGRCAGESSISAGVLIDLKRLNKVDLSEDQSSCKVGPGNSWRNAYTILNPRGLTVVGGRASSVGVGGFCVSGELNLATWLRCRSINTLLGGISFYSNRHGWALDNVISFEIVLPNGKIVDANKSSHPDLYKALRGGGANFGIVTELNLNVYPCETFWGGVKNCEWEYGDAMIDAFFEYGNDNVNNVDAAVIFGALSHQGRWIWHAELEHLKPTPPDERSALRGFLSIPSIAAPLGPTSQIARADGIAGAYVSGSYNGFWTFCTVPDKRIVKFFFETWREEVDPIVDIDGIERAGLADINFASQNIIETMKRNGGNALGLADKGPFLVYLMEPYWTVGAQSHRVWRALHATALRTQAEAKRLGVHHEYIYLNYANPFQDVFSSYGPEAKRFLEVVSAKYDPEGMFQKQRGAGWNFHGSLSESTGIKPPVDLGI